MSKKQKTPLQKYLSEPLPPYRRGSSDCVAFVAGWVNVICPENIITLLPKTFGDVVRLLREKTLIEQVNEHLECRGFLDTSTPTNGDVVVFECEDALNGQAVGIVSEDKVVTRMEGEKLFVESNPKILKAWKFTLSTS